MTGPTEKQIEAVANVISEWERNRVPWNTMPSARQAFIERSASALSAALAVEAGTDEAVAPHTDDLAVDRFAEAMKAKLAKKRGEGRGGWQNKDECSADFLSQLLREHVDKGDPVDVGNLAMMLHQRGERVSPQPSADKGE